MGRQFRRSRKSQGYLDLGPRQATLASSQPGPLSEVTNHLDAPCGCQTFVYGTAVEAAVGLAWLRVMEDRRLHFAGDLYQGTAEYYDRYRLPYPEAMIEDLLRALRSPGRVDCLTWPAVPASSPFLSAGYLRGSLGR